MIWTEAERKREVAPVRGSWAVRSRPRDMGDNVTLTRDGAIATVTLCRPERRNALSDAMLAELAQALAALRDDAATRGVALGVPLGTASTARFVRLVGPARAKEIILECRRYTAAEAQALGLVHRVVPGGDLRTAVSAYAEALAAKPQRALAEANARINAIARTGIPEVNAMTEGFLDRG